MLFTHCAEEWFAESEQAPATKEMRRGHYRRHIYPAFKDRVLGDITEGDVRSLCQAVKALGVPASAIQVLSIVKQVFSFAMFKRYKADNPARFIPNSSIAKLSPRNRVLSSDEIGLLYRLMDDVQVQDYYRLATRLLFLTLARRAELLLARWTEIDFEGHVWRVPPGRVKSTKTRQIYLSTQALDILIQLKTLAGHSEYIFPSPLDSYLPMAPACLDVYTHRLCRRAQKLDLSLRNFAPSDLRSTAENHLKQVGFDWEWVEVALAREVSLQRLHIHESDLHAVPLRHMMQEWASMIDGWVAGTPYVPTLLPPSLSLPTAQGWT